MTESTVTYRGSYNDACGWKINYILLLFNLMLKWNFLFKLPVFPVSVAGIAGERKEINNKVSFQYLHSVPKIALWRRKLYCRCLQNATGVKTHVNLSKLFIFRFRAFSHCGSKFRTNILLLYSLIKYLYRCREEKPTRWHWKIYCT